MWEVALQASIAVQLHLVCDIMLSTDTDRGWAEPLGDAIDHEPKILLCPCHVSIVVVLIDKVDWRNDQLPEMHTMCLHFSNGLAGEC